MFQYCEIVLVTYLLKFCMVSTAVHSKVSLVRYNPKTSASHIFRICCCEASINCYFLLQCIVIILASCGIFLSGFLHYCSSSLTFSSVYCLIVPLLIVYFSTLLDNCMPLCNTSYLPSIHFPYIAISAQVHFLLISVSQFLP